MPYTLSRKVVISRAALLDVAEARLREARVLFEAKQYAGAAYLAGYAVECYLKVAICTRLDWDHLYGEFKTHDLEGLLLYSGLDRKLRANPSVLESFVRISKSWSGADARYRAPAGVREREANDFLSWVNDPERGVLPWLKDSLS